MYTEYKTWVKEKAIAVYISVARIDNYTVRRIILNNHVVIETRIRERRGT